MPVEKQVMNSSNIQLMLTFLQWYFVYLDLGLDYTVEILLPI